MNIITIFNVGFRIDYWKTDVHPYFTKNLTVKPKIKHVSIRFWKWKYEKIFTPTYKITVKWTDVRTPTYQLEYLLEATKGIKYIKDYDHKTIEIFFKGEDHIRNNFEDIIKNMRMYIQDYVDYCECDESESEEPKPIKFEIEVILID